MIALEKLVSFFPGIFCFHKQGCTMNSFVLQLCSEQVSSHGPLSSTNAIDGNIYYLWLKQKISPSPSSRMCSSSALAKCLYSCKLFFFITNSNLHCWIYLWNTVSIGRYPTLCWNSEHLHGYFTVGSRYVFDDNASLERRYVLISVLHVSISFFLSLNAAVGWPIVILPNILGNLYCKILIHHGRHWVVMNLQIDSPYLSCTSLSFKIN